MSNPSRERLQEILRRTGLGSLWRHFEDEGIDDGVLGSLTEGDLERIGIEKMGDRRRIMVVIKETVSWVKPVEVRSSYVGPEMVLVEGGALPVGSAVPEKRVGRFWMGKYEVTWGEWKEVREWAVNKKYEMEEGQGEGEKHPVTKVNWYSVVKWCNARSEKEGLVPVYVVGVLGGKVYRKGSQDKVAMKAGANGYRLPSEGEWEWAARGGVKGRGYEYSGSNDSGEVGWFDGNSWGKTHEVGTKKANELGIFDLSGNADEWCFDWYGGGATGAGRVKRGGGWGDYACFARFSFRSYTGPAASFNRYGFRVVRSSVP